MKKRPLVSFVVVASVALAAFAVWRIQDTRAKVNGTGTESLKGLSAEDIRIVLASEAEPPSSGIPEDVQARKSFLKGMREYLALAAAARDEGMTADAAFLINFEHKRNILLADLYKAELSREKGGPYVVDPAAMEGVWKDASNQKQFETDMATLQEIQNTVARERGENYTVAKLQGGSLTKARDNWSRVRVLSEMAKKDKEFISQPVIALRSRILEAGILSTDYLRKHWSEIRATEGEIASFIQSHPEYDVARKREKAESILKQARAGADFAGLASKFSEDRTTREKGGLHENVEKGLLWEQVENAALEAGVNKVVDHLVETETGFHIVKLVNKTVQKDAAGNDSIKLSLRHILLQKKFEDPQNKNPDVPSPFLSSQEIAKATVENEKRNRLVDSVLLKYQINLPEDFIASILDRDHLDFALSDHQERAI